ncbi:MAG: MGMT family protein [Phycisphaeraceae bacterium]
MSTTTLTLPNHTIHWLDHLPEPAEADLAWGIATTPLGRIRVTTADHIICAFDLLEDDRQTAPLPTHARHDDPVAQTILDQVLDDQPHTFTVAPEGTAFQKAVWHALLSIPHGSTATYADIARRLGRNPSAARAVGGAVGSNPIALLIPCHRVIGTSGQLTGFGWGLQRKETLLRAEGITLF